MAKTKIQEIISIMKNKSLAKQQAYRATFGAMEEIKKVLKGYEQNLGSQVIDLDANLEMKFYDAGPFEAHLKFSGDTLVFMMHTNVFDFDNNHAVHKTKYVSEDPLREHCGLIQIYNFLSDSLKYNREGDLGNLVARIFINKERHFFMDGRRPFNILYNDFEKMVLNEMHINNIIEEAMLYCLNFDLLVPPFDLVNAITVEQKNMSSYSSGFHTSKRMGFQASYSSDTE